MQSIILKHLITVSLVILGSWWLILEQSTLRKALLLELRLVRSLFILTKFPRYYCLSGSSFNGVSIHSVNLLSLSIEIQRTRSMINLLRLLNDTGWLVVCRNAYHVGHHIVLLHLVLFILLLNSFKYFLLN